MIPIPKDEVTLTYMWNCLLLKPLSDVALSVEGCAMSFYANCACTQISLKGGYLINLLSMTYSKVLNHKRNITYLALARQGVLGKLSQLPTADSLVLHSSVHKSHLHLSQVKY